ncbi:mediator complex subunit MED10 [Toxoplasma gondii RUB]|uniref:Mediator of RNA polymerase II transcription subunit 10 n=2 Tax=Toxoplasma gondii TaxID=5811 RepID=A0A086M3C1_TOXGO|nr:mediator complex subunit MED10 [Toxoplasma gondii RUB]
MSLQPSSTSFPAVTGVESLDPSPPHPYAAHSVTASSSSPFPSSLPTALSSSFPAPDEPDGDVNASSDDHSSLSNFSSDGGNDSDDDVRAAPASPNHGDAEGPTKRAKVAGDATAEGKAHRKPRDKSATASDRHRRKIAKLYFKTLHCLTKLTLLLEDGTVILPPGKADNKGSRRLSKLLLRYDRMLMKLEAYMSSSSQLANASVPVGLLQALDKNVDPVDWLKRCVLDVHREKNDQLRGVYDAFGAYEATLHDAIRYNACDRLLPRFPRFSTPASAPSSGPPSSSASAEFPPSSPSPFPSSHPSSLRSSSAVTLPSPSPQPTSETINAASHAS